jgi:hypothetical protein
MHKAELNREQPVAGVCRVRVSYLRTPQSPPARSNEKRRWRSQPQKRARQARARRQLGRSRHRHGPVSPAVSRLATIGSSGRGGSAFMQLNFVGQFAGKRSAGAFHRTNSQSNDEAVMTPAGIFWSLFERLGHHGLLLPRAISRDQDPVLAAITGETS